MTGESILFVDYAILPGKSEPGIKAGEAAEGS